MSKEEKLKPRLLESVDRLSTLIRVNAPGVIIGAEAWHLFTTVLAVYGSSAGSTMIEGLRDKNLHSRGVCGWEDCTNYVDRPNVGICPDCQKKLGLEDVVEVLPGEPDA